MAKKSSMPTSESQPQNWLWVTRPKYYLDEGGLERSDLDPSNGEDTSGWWTCHKNTLRGDFILLWRTSPKCDIGYLIQARSDAYSITDDSDANESNWEYGCEYLPLHKFRNPLAIAEIRNDPYLNEWSALRGRFQRTVFAITPEIWGHLMRRLSEKNPDFKRILGQLKSEQPIAQEILLEEDLENHLVDNLEILRPHGYDLELIGRQVICKGHGGRIDLLCLDRKAGRYVVIELKNVRAGQNTFGQIMTYVGWVNEHYPKRKPALGLVIARGVDNRYLSAATTTPNVKHLTLEQLGFL
jgi:hypothetical protein